MSTKIMVICIKFCIPRGRGMTIGERIKKIRGSMSREKFSELTGVSKNTLINYETGSSSPVAAYLDKLLELFPDTNPKWLLVGDAVMKYHLDDELLETVIVSIEEQLAGMGRTATPTQKAQLIIALYDLSCGGGNHVLDKKTVSRLVKLATASA